MWKAIIIIECSVSVQPDFCFLCYAALGKQSNDDFFVSILTFLAWYFVTWHLHFWDLKWDIALSFYFRAKKHKYRLGTVLHDLQRILYIYIPFSRQFQIYITLLMSPIKILWTYWTGKHNNNYVAQLLAGRFATKTDVIMNNPSPTLEYVRA